MQRLRRSQVVQSFAQGAVADLVVVLQEQYESAGWQMSAGLTTRCAVAGGMALVGKALTQAAGEFCGRLVSEVGVISVGFARQQHVQRVMAVIVPLRVEALFQKSGLIDLEFQREPDMPCVGGRL